MKIAIMQPYFLPYIGYFQLISLVDKFIIYDDVNFIKRGWINRNRILSNSSDLMISIPLEKASQNKKINEHFISDQTDWKKKMLMNVKHSYNKAPYFESAFELFEKILDYEEKELSPFLFNSINKLCSFLDIDTELISSSSIYNNQQLKGQHRILDICLQESGDHYINPTGGKLLYDKKYFDDNEVTLNFLETDEIRYDQYGDKFVPFLSILDVIMFNRKESIKLFLNNYRLE